MGLGGLWVALVETKEPGTKPVTGDGSGSFDGDGELVFGTRQWIVIATFLVIEIFVSCVATSHILTPPLTH